MLVRSLANLLLVATISVLIFAGCDSNKNQDNSQSTATPVPQSSNVAATSDFNDLEVLSTQEAAGYIYIEVNSQNGGKWIATNRIPVKTGDRVSFSNGQVMTNFHSKTLNKTFDKILFVDTVSVNGQMPAGGMMSSTAPASGKTTAAKTVAVAAGDVKKASGGYTVEELYQKKASLTGKTIKVRGKVVKSLSGIMGKNWIHLQDGTGSGDSGTHDITATTLNTAQQGDTVVIEGQLVADKDFGQGYFYPLIIENSTVTVER